MQLATLLTTPAAERVLDSKAAMFASLAPPMGPRAEMCAATLEMPGLPQEAKDCMCDDARPYLVCQSLVHLYVHPVMQAVLKAAQGTPRGSLPGASTASFAGTAGKKSCGAGLSGLLGESDLCLEADCEVDFKKIISIGIKGEACIPNFIWDAINNKINTCPKKSGMCTEKEIVKYELVRFMTGLAESTSIDIQVYLCAFSGKSGSGWAK